MQFYKVFFLSLVCLVSGASMAAYENADSIIEAIAIEQGVPVSRLVLPRGVKVAQNISENLKHASSKGERSGELSLMPHTRRLGDIHFFWKPYLPQSEEEVLQSYFFPNMEYLTPNTMPKNDPISNLNRARLKSADEKNNASLVLGKMVRVIHDALESEETVGLIEEQLLKAWGLADSKKIKVFKDIDEATFQRQELMRAFIKGGEIIRGHLAQEEEDGEEDDNRSEEFQIIKDAWKKEDELTLWAQQFFPDLFKHGHLEVGMLETWVKENEEGKHKIQEENLKRLRKRQIAQLMAHQVQQERDGEREKDDSSILSLMMTFFWKTASAEGLYPFFKGFFGKGFKLEAEEEERFIGLVERDTLERLLDETIKNPGSFWHMTETEKFALLRLEESNRLFRFPILGTAVLPAGQDFADCMELALRKKFYHLLKDPKTGSIRYDLLPEGPFQAYFKEYAEEEKRLSQKARNDWAVLMTQIPGAQFRKDGYELDPSVENYIAVLQAVMGNDEAIVRPLEEGIDKASLFQKYEDFLKKASTWFTSQLKRPVSFEGDGDWSMVLEKDQLKTIGLVNMKIATVRKPFYKDVPLEKVDAEAWEIPPHEVAYINMLGGTTDAHAEYNLTDRKEGAETKAPLADQVWDMAGILEQKKFLLPWMTPSLMTKIDGMKDAEFKDALLSRWLSLNLVDYPSLYPVVIKWAIEKGVADQSFIRPGLLNEYQSRKDILLIIHRLLQNPETAPVVSDAVLDQFVLASPDFLHTQAPLDPCDRGTRAKSMLELMVDRERWDLLREVSPKVKGLMFDIDHQDIFTAPFWQNLDKAAEALEYVKEIDFVSISNALYPENGEGLAEILEKINVFEAPNICFATLTPETLEAFLPAFSGHVERLKYRTAHNKGNQVTPEEEAEAESQLNQKLAELQAAGKIGPDVVLASARD